MTKPTIGPWRIDYDGDSLPIIIGPDSNSGFIAYIRDADHTQGRAEANAHLIAAAPELLEACKAALGAFTNNNAIDWNELEKAIAIAEGRYA